MTREISGPSVTRCDSEGPGTRAFGTLYIHTQVTVRGAGTPLISNQSKHNSGLGDIEKDMDGFAFLWVRDTGKE